jgi:energy-coupling factor transporter ATP-binding protein EcfA2
VRYAGSVTADRITQLDVGGMRCIAASTLELGAFTVLIGENGAGKSTIVEAAELLRKAATEAPFVEKLYQPHDGTRLFRSGANLLRLGACIEGNGSPLLYGIEVLRDGTYLSISSEIVTGLDKRILMSRNRTSAACPEPHRHR